MICSGGRGFEPHRSQDRVISLDRTIPLDRTVPLDKEIPLDKAIPLKVSKRNLTNSILSLFDLPLLASCKAGWQLFSGSCYKHFNLEKTWQDANKTCNAEDAELMSIHTEAENNFLRSIVTKYWSWIGFNDIAKEGKFVWSNGSPRNYTKWASGEPNDYAGREDCTAVAGNGEWNDKACTYQKPFTCRYT